MQVDGRKQQEPFIIKGNMEQITEELESIESFMRDIWDSISTIRALATSLEKERLKLLQ